MFVIFFFYFIHNHDFLKAWIGNGIMWCYIFIIIHPDTTNCQFGCTLSLNGTVFGRNIVKHLKLSNCSRRGYPAWWLWTKALINVSQSHCFPVTPSGNIHTGQPWPRLSNCTWRHQTVIGANFESEWLTSIKLQFQRNYVGYNYKMGNSDYHVDLIFRLSWGQYVQ